MKQMQQNLPQPILGFYPTLNPIYVHLMIPIPQRTADICCLILFHGSYYVTIAILYGKLQLH